MAGKPTVLEMDRVKACMVPPAGGQPPANGAVFAILLLRSVLV